MPAAQDKIVYLYFICNCIVKSLFYCFLVLFNYIFYVNESTGSWHGDLKGYKHKSLLVIFLFTCKVASGSTPLTFANLLLQGCGTGRFIELQVWSSHQHEQAQ